MKNTNNPCEEEALKFGQTTPHKPQHSSPNLCGSKDPPDQIVSYNEKNEGAGQMN
ncbi:hypothetical protein AAZX31_02G243800 [Glycine max]|uniref:Uncharacterized protein n=2 Tax=Glycine subgen. Soja TaxID=1462606 RepID=A0A0R0L8U9_SOYBN|nr:hypothetical protein JHK87_005279 [Glycine soja]KAG5064421.1 hypothetical protein JHK85_005604 [Glycine max]KAG5081375.1 hypothetical protein JHK86_005440 [Glycine max]KAH1062126.1 hypothetical protein GYH30_005240 [Glycine max]KRH73224.1 hypothetical protein GLYMA_02G259900v4 [Glycine max]